MQELTISHFAVFEARLLNLNIPMLSEYQPFDFVFFIYLLFFPIRAKNIAIDFPNYKKLNNY